jgi:2-desacetyl-2-hydroxyethyl bacteriochlorophyllide A dehydrogenase
MLALRKLTPGFGVALAEAAAPQTPAPGDVLIEVEAAGICGSDLHIYDAKGSAYDFLWPRLPLTLGHEFCGRVVRLGAGAPAALLDRRVVALPVGIGTQRDGCFAPWVTVPAAHCLPIPDTLDAELGALIEPLTVAHHAVACAGIGPGQRLLVMGAGAIAQGAALFARLAGARQIVVTGHADTHRFAVLRRMGFDTLVDRAEAGSDQRLAALAGEGFDAVIEMTGVASTVDEGLGLLRRQGVLVATGIHPAPGAIDITRLVRRQLQLRGSYGNTREGWQQVIDTVAAHPAQFAPLVTHRYALRDGLQAFEAAYSRVATKALLFPHSFETRTPR